MNAPKLLIIAAFAFLLFWLLPENNATMSVWRSHTDTNSSRHLTWMDELPEAYQLEIVFPDYTHTHTVNNGTEVIRVTVNETERSFTLGMATRCSAHYDCDVDGQSVQIYGDISVDVSSEYVGEISEEKRKNNLREKALNTIIEQFASL